MVKNRKKERKKNPGKIMSADRYVGRPRTHDEPRTMDLLHFVELHRRRNK